MARPSPGELAELSGKAGRDSQTIASMLGTSGKAGRDSQEHTPR